MNNKKLIADFLILQKYYEKTGDMGRSIAYRKAIGILKKIDQPIVNLSQLRGIKGIGKSILDKIDEWIKTGKIEIVEKIKKIPLSEKEQVLEKLQTVWGIGKKIALHFYNMGVREISDLEKFKNSLTNGQKIGLKYHKELSEKIPREFIIITEVILRYHLNNHFGKENYKLEIAGSYRRCAPYSNDIDCLISSDHFTLYDVVTLLKDKGIIIETFSLKGQKFMGIAGCKGDSRKVHLDIQFIPKNEWGTALLYFTGSKEFNLTIRGYAKSKGFRLNEHGILDIKTQKIKYFSDERDVFGFLNIDYIPPRMR